MGSPCQVTKCATPECTVKMKKCDLKEGLCTVCYQNKQNGTTNNSTVQELQQPN